MTDWDKDLCKIQVLAANLSTNVSLTNIAQGVKQKIGNNMALPG